MKKVGVVIPGAGRVWLAELLKRDGDMGGLGGRGLLGVVGV